MLATLEEYAKLNGVTFSTIRSNVHRGKFTNLIKVGTRTYIDAATPYPCGKRTPDQPRESETRLYNVWRMMKQRCNNPKATRYKSYGGKGIRVCQEWEHNFAAFKTWAEANGYNDTLTIDRIDPMKNYEPNNCRWVTRAENNRYRIEYQRAQRTQRVERVANREANAQTAKTP